MRPEPNLLIEKFRASHPSLPPSPPGVNYGYFQDRHLRIISSGSCEDNPESKNWEHVSVSCANRCPTWDEMKHVKELFWLDSETATQFHPRKISYKNDMANCLHMWRKSGVEPELPPDELI